MTSKFLSFFMSLGLLLMPIFLTGTTHNLSLIINMENQKELPRNFRMTIDRFLKIEAKPPSNRGLPELHASASGQFSENALIKIKDTIPTDNVLILDLREESHGFINGIAVSWYDKDKDWSNKDKPLEDILSDERKRLNQTHKGQVIALNKKSSKPHDKPLLIKVEDSYTEEELVKSLGFKYLRIPVTDHLKPDDHEVDQFVNLIKHEISSNQWLHFHCSAGRGRATTFLSMYDMMKNAQHVSFNDIILRQALIGGKDLSEHFHVNDWRYSHNIERIQFLVNFYYYCIENPNFEQSWSTWISKDKK